MKKSYLQVLTVISAFAVCGTARADLSFSTSPTITSYLGSPVYTSVAATSATVAQGNPAIVGSAANFVLSETFTPSSSYTLNEIHILGGVSVPNTGLSVHLFNVTGVDKQAASAFYFPGVDLFGAGAGLSFTVAPGGESQWIFSLSNGSTLDQINLISGNTYAVEIWTPAAVTQNGFQWYRGGVVATDGQMMGAGDSASTQSRNTIAALGLAGGAPRTASLALYAAAVPEPSSIALLGLGSLAALIVRRKKA